jgi:hypothetical protein
MVASISSDSATGHDASRVCPSQAGAPRPEARGIEKLKHLISTRRSYQMNSIPSHDGQYQQQFPNVAPQQVSPAGFPQQAPKYQHATPLHGLGESSAPVDCPSCRQRELTRVEYHSGQTTL